MAIWIRTIDDLAQLSDDEMVRCMRALRGAILRAKSGRPPALDRERNDSVRFEGFVWRPPAMRTGASFGPDTLIDEIVPREPARAALKAIGIVRVVDLTEISLGELTEQAQIGCKTIVLLREALARLGLEFQERAVTDPRLSTSCRRSRDDRTVPLFESRSAIPSKEQHNPD